MTGKPVPREQRAEQDDGAELERRGRDEAPPSSSRPAAGGRCVIRPRPAELREGGRVAGGGLPPHGDPRDRLLPAVAARPGWPRRASPPASAEPEVDRREPRQVHRARQEPGPDLRDLDRDVSVSCTDVLVGARRRVRRRRDQQRVHERQAFVEPPADLVAADRRAVAPPRSSVRRAPTTRTRSASTSARRSGSRRSGCASANSGKHTARPRRSRVLHAARRRRARPSCPRKRAPSPRRSTAAAASGCTVLQHVPASGCRSGTARRACAAASRGQVAQRPPGQHRVQRHASSTVAAIGPGVSSLGASGSIPSIGSAPGRDLQPERPAERRRDPDRAARVRAERERHDARRDGRGRAAARPAGHPGGIPRVPRSRRTPSTGSSRRRPARAGSSCRPSPGPRRARGRSWVRRDRRPGPRRRGSSRSSRARRRRTGP